MLYLLDADTLIRAASTFYRLKRVPQFWDWLQHQGSLGNVKIPVEQFEEIIAGKGDLVDWLKDQDVKAALLLDEEAEPKLVATVTLLGYGNLDENEIEKVGRDPFLISYGAGMKGERRVVTFENSAPGKKGKNRKIPDVCNDLDVDCCTLFDMIEALDFTTDWKPE